MKASLKFREDQAPLLRTKFPISVCGIPLSSGMALSNKQDLTVHLGTCFEAGPSCRISYKPNDICSPFSLILKTGFGLWGSPNGATLTMMTEFHLAGNVGPYFSIQVKPKVGDFSLRRHISSLNPNPSPNPNKLGCDTEESLYPSRSGSLNNSDNITLSTPKTTSGFVSPAEKHKSPIRDYNMVIGSNFTFKIEGFDREKKGRGVDPLRPKSDDGIRSNVNNVSGDSFPEELVARGRTGLEASNPPRPYLGAFQGWTAHAQSCLPLGRHAKLDILWGVNIPWENNHTRSNGWFGFSMAKLPFLVVNKLSIEGVFPKPRMEYPVNLVLFKEMPLLLDNPNVSLEGSDSGNGGESLKRQLQHLSEETKALRRDMEELRNKPTRGVGVVSSSSSYLLEPTDNTRASEESESARKKAGARETNRRDTEGNKELEGSKSAAPLDVSEESKKTPTKNTVSSGSPGLKKGFHH